MQTYSHFLLTAAAREGLKKRNIPVHGKAFLFGAVAPDMPLLMLTLGYFLYRTWFDPMQPGEFIFGPRFDNLYFTNPFWIAGHNLLHAPLLIALYAFIGWLAGRSGRWWGFPLFWFAIACGFHSFLDILTHHNDGPLLLFPFDWQLRFHSPVSYWDPRYNGRTFALFEHLLNFAILLYFLAAWLRNRFFMGPKVP